MSRRLTSLCWLFRHQHVFHIGGNAQLSCYSYSLGSFRTGWQFFGICWLRGCLGIPVVSISLCVFHSFVPSAANLAPRKANRSRWIPSDRLGQSVCERDRISDIRRCAGRCRMIPPRLWKVTSELECKPGSEGVQEAIDTLMVDGDMRTFRAP
jgi:hypothetical protein